MEVIIKKDKKEMSKEAAEIVRDAIQKKPNLVLGLATGSTPIGLYEELIRMHREEGLDFSQVTTFNLDEYLGIPLEHPESYHSFMYRNLFDHVNIPRQSIHIPTNSLQNIDSFCEWYEDRIEECGGIDLQILGIGRDGHLGFNEPSSSLGSRTRIKTLTQETVEDNARFFDGDMSKVPRLVVTMGIGTIMDARVCLMLANGSSKVEAVARAIEGPVTAEVTASALQWHEHAIAIVDEEAAAGLQRADYYRWVYENKQKLIRGEFQ